MHKELKKLRKRIDKIDKELKKLLEKRAKVAIEIGELKKKNSLPVEDSIREEEVLNKIEDSFTKKAFKEIIKLSKEIQS